MQKKPNVTLLIKKLEIAHQGKAQTDAWLVMTLCFKLFTVLSLFKPVLLIIAQSFMVNLAIEVLVELVALPS